MQNFGLEIAEGSEIVNITVPTGTSFPANDNVGEMFYRTDEDALYVRNNTTWEVVTSGFLSPSTTSNVSVGYTTDVEVLASDTIAPDMSLESIKTRTVAGNITINFPTGGNGVCHIVATIDGTNRTVTLGANVKSVGTIADLTASTTQLITVIRDSATHAIVQIQEVSA